MTTTTRSPDPTQAIEAAQIITRADRVISVYLTEIREDYIQLVIGCSWETMFDYCGAIERVQMDNPELNDTEKRLRAADWTFNFPDRPNGVLMRTRLDLRVYPTTWMVTRDELQLRFAYEDPELILKLAKKARRFDPSKARFEGRLAHKWTFSTRAATPGSPQYRVGISLVHQCPALIIDDAADLNLAIEGAELVQATQGAAAARRYVIDFRTGPEEGKGPQLYSEDELGAILACIAPDNSVEVEEVMTS